MLIRHDKKSIFFTVCFLFFTFNSVCFSGEESQDIILRAKSYLNEHKYEQALGSLDGYSSSKSLDEKKLLLRGICYVWLEEWDKAKGEFNKIASISGEIGDVQCPKPLRLNNPPSEDEFYAKRFTVDDMRYLWRSLWAENIASRICKGKNSPMEKAVSILDYVFRQVKFGTNKQGFLTDKPFNVLIKSQGFCDEQSWILNQLLRSAGFDALRLLLVSPLKPTSPHTISMVKIEENWIPMDPSYGIILQGAGSGLPKTFPKNFLINPSEEDYKKFGGKLLFSIKEYGEALRELGYYENLISEISHARPAFDYEFEAYTPRFIWLAEKIDKVYPIKGLSHRYVNLRFPTTDFKTDDIIKWRTLELQYIFDSTEKRNRLIREESSRRFAYLEPLRKARLEHLRGHLHSAEEMFISLQSSESLSLKACEDVSYYLGVIAFDEGNYQKAKKRFSKFLLEFPATRWKDRVLYHEALIANMEGRDDDVAELITECRQASEGSLFNWMIALDKRR